MTVLDSRALNRATLARQHLLTRTDTSVPETVALRVPINHPRRLGA
ncbi:hypothetical protein [Streptomyces lonegramiae]|uniref:Uncharacterized protein n=1 Tax=Streptomyces lonegramiae TaxID=3075524 RepID=A0ABU2XV43_9ACTN|nr:hypothetical protein [Streptomyces sp. DSM 41529]MDT0549405.1 hypothetical protein [Streptomyces sp. DSM 41529]